MGTNTGLGIGIGIPFKNNALGGDKPYFPPELKARMIGVWTNYGKKNTDADRNIIKNKIPNAGGDLEILNAAYKLNSGFGEYKVDFLDWTINSPFINERTSFTFSSFNNTNNDIITVYQRVPAVVQSFKIKAKLRGKVLYRYYVNKGDTISVSYYEVKEGINILPDSVDPTSVNGKVGFVLKELSSIKVEQIPNLEGAFVTDGVNDLIISQKTVKEMIGDNDEITVISMIYYINTDAPARITITNDIRGMTAEDKSSQVFARNGVSIKGIGKLGIYGWSKKGTSTTVYSYFDILGDKVDYESTANYGLADDAKFCPVGEPSLRFLSKQAHYWSFMVIGKLTEDEINLIVANYNLDRSLKPDILCNIGKQGITNGNHAKFNNKLIDYSGNGRDIQMNNLAWKGGSGIAAKKFETIKDYSIIPDEGLQELTIYNEFSFKIKSIRYADRYWAIQSLNKTDTSYPVTIITDKDIIWRNALNYTDADGVKSSIRKETNVSANTPTQVFIYGFNDFDISDDYTKVNCVAYATRKDITEFTVTFIPSHKGGILLDGVDDFGKVTGMPIYKDYTVVTDREIFTNTGAISSKNNPGAFVETSGNSVYSFGQGTSGLKLISTRSISYLSKYSYCGQSITAGAAEDGTDMWLGTIRDGDSRFFNGTIYSLMSFPYSMSKFLIERQLKKYKLGTLYPDMVEFRPIISSNIPYDKIEFFNEQWTKRIYPGDYVEIGATIKANLYLNNYDISTITSLTSSQFESVYIDRKIKYYDVVLSGIKKSPQKITMTIEQDENYVKFEPVITSNVEYVRLDFYLNNYQKRINIGDYIPKDVYLRANLYLKNNVDELTVFTFNGVNIGYRRSPYDDTAFNIGHIHNYDSPQEVNITIDEYIRYEEIVQPYPVLLRFNDENGNEVSWGGKFRVGSTITRIGSAADSNLLPNIYNIFGLLLNDNQVTSSKIIVEKTMVFKAKSAYIFDNNEPKCILSPRLLRIPNSSYKILGYIPDISGHGNHGVIHNSAYAEGSGVNEDGSYQFDGVDDFVTIPTVTGGKQVLMKVNWQSEVGGVTLYDQRLNLSDYEFAIYNGTRDLDDNPVMAYQGRNNGQTYIDGILNSNIMASELRNITHNITITNELSLGTNNTYPVIGSTRSNTHFAQMSLYDFMLFDEISTDDKIKELNEYVGVEAKVELPPYYWDTYGKTNSDADRDTIQQRGVAVGDYDLINYNHAYEGMSGYNGYPVVFGANKTWEILSSVYGYISDVTSTTIHVTMVKNAGTGLLFNYVKKDEALTNIKEIPAFRVTIKGLEGNSKFGYRYLATEDATEETLVYLGNGTHELAKSFAPTEALLNLTRNAWVGIFITPMVEGEVVFDCDITIEVLPEYENGLAYDGITDYSKNANIPVLTDYTYIYKRTIINIPTNAATLLKGADKTNGGAFIADYGNKWQFNFGQYNIIQGIADGINWQTVNSFNGTPINKGENTDDSGITVAKFSNGYTSMVFYKLILYPKTISLLEINFLKNLMEKDEIIDLTNPIFIKNE